MSPAPLVFSKGVQLTVYIDNRKGTLATLAEFLGKHGVNIYGLTLADTEGHGYARLIVDDTEKARQLVEDSGELVGARDVLLVRVQNEPGQLGRVLAALAARNLNIEYGYSSGGPDDEKGLVLVPSDMEAAMAALAAFRPGKT
ncbi:MAG TPA: ACT domain-containing protein [Kiritimatiellia bacterium]|nr:ACT domain-containing protein [Kiritimatiellia bacterium]HPJ56943.1 ACT domain-containing protein [Kiritimatiellia bacterium]HPR67894.1 ACT domain-containing protein [Kiritimatiellia bacterium]HRX05530.1 ACT domain-containing protein [Kiritimatiellia bacterium]